MLHGLVLRLRYFTIWASRRYLDSASYFAKKVAIFQVENGKIFGTAPVILLKKTPVILQTPVILTNIFLHETTADPNLALNATEQIIFFVSRGSYYKILVAIRKYSTET